MENYHAWLNTALVLASVLLTATLARTKSVRLNEREIAELKVKVETMWNFLLRRGAVEGVSQGLMTFNSPLRLTERSAEMFEHLAGELKAFYNERPGINEHDLAIAIEKEFGSRLATEICLPNNISLGVCLLIATAVARGGHTLTEILDEYHVPKLAKPV